ncbi:uncharacterized protein LOC126666979 [Mercurialis annua]|uniref:uncharacterized protein LOC126666979 n=1 Tax=Mercurialis annua TaxID=3986 RepID=UPI0021610A7D|nr:uncharacterized protein LOC126666979 [Mercurialis annua]
MVIFKETTSSTSTNLHILDNEASNFEEGTTLAVYTPVIGRHAPTWSSSNDALHLSSWSLETARDTYGCDNAIIKASRVTLLQSSLHKTSSSHDALQLLRHRIQSGELSWGSSSSFFVGATYTECYWEWAEDVLASNEHNLTSSHLYAPIFASLFTYDFKENVMRGFCEHWDSSTNTLCTAKGEESISLWDLKMLGGLSIDGSFYDEVIPSANELNGIDRDGKPSLPISCKFLFLAFHKGCKKMGNHYEMTISDWIKCWFCGPSRYREPPKRDNKKRSARPRETYNPSGVIDKCQRRAKGWYKPFSNLHVKVSDREEVYLAAFISCWLCKFVLPGRDAGLIRPSTFKVASMMATSRRFCLAVPVLASIYHGLRGISTASDFKTCAVSFPTHYVYGWLAHRFETHFSSNRERVPLMTSYAGERMARTFEDSAALALFRNPSQLIIPSFNPSTKRTTLTDDKDLSLGYWEYLASLRSSYLVARLDHVYIYEPYSPHRFSRQFGFCQDIPGDLKQHLEGLNLDQIVRLWQSCTRSSTLARIKLPMVPDDGKTFVTKDYFDWWSRKWLKTPVKESRLVIKLKTKNAGEKILEAATNEIVDVVSTCAPIGATKKRTTQARAYEVSSGSQAEKRTPSNNNDSTHTFEDGIKDMDQDRLDFEETDQDDSDRHWNRQKKTKLWIPGDPKDFGSIPSGSFPQCDKLLDLHDLNFESNCEEYGDIEDTALSSESFKLVARALEDGHQTNFIQPSHAILVDNTTPLEENALEQQKEVAPKDKRNAFEKTQLCGADMFLCFERQVATLSWEALQKRLITTPLSEIPSMAEAISTFLDMMKKYESLDTSILKERLNSLLQNIREVNKKKSELHSSMSVIVRDKELERLQGKLDAFIEVENEAANDCSTLRTRIDEAKEELKKLESSLEVAEKKIQDNQENASKTRDEISHVEVASVHDPNDEAKLQELESLLEANFDDFNHFQWSP